MDTMGSNQFSWGITFLKSFATCIYKDLLRKGEILIWKQRTVDLYAVCLRIFHHFYTHTNWSNGTIIPFWFWICLFFKSNKVCLVIIRHWLTVLFCTSIRPNSKVLLPLHYAPLIQIFSCSINVKFLQKL